MPILILNLLRNNWKIVFAITCFVLYSIGVYNRGAESVRAEWDSANTSATVIARQIETDNRILSGIIEGKHHATIESIDSTFNDAVKRLRSNPSSNLPCTSTPPSSANATTRASGIHKANGRLKLAKEAELNTQKLISLQEWVQEVK